MKGRSGFGWLELIEGILLLLLGGYTLARPNDVLTGFVVVYGLLAVVMGIADIVLYVRAERYVGFGPIVALISGTLSVMAGIMLLVYPHAGQMILSLLFPLWFIAHCVSRLANLNRIRFFSGEVPYYCTLVLNIIGLILGTLMLVNPWITLLSLRYIIGFYLILLGINSVVLAFSNMGAK